MSPQTLLLAFAALPTIEAAAAGAAQHVRAAAREPPPPAACERIGSYEGSEDITLWRGGVAFISSGLFPSATQSGLLLAIDLGAPRPAPREVELRGVPAGFGFRPHGLYLDNATQRLFVISHRSRPRAPARVFSSILS